MTSSNFNYHIKAPSPNTITLRIRALRGWTGGMGNGMWQPCQEIVCQFWREGMVAGTQGRQPMDGDSEEGVGRGAPEAPQGLGSVRRGYLLRRVQEGVWGTCVPWFVVCGNATGLRDARGASKHRSRCVCEVYPEDIGRLSKEDPCSPPWTRSICGGSKESRGLKKRQFKLHLSGDVCLHPSSPVLGCLFPWSSDLRT